MRKALFVAALFCAGCSGGGGATPQPIATFVTAQATPSAAPTTVPTNQPTSAPTVAATATPVPLSQRAIAGAPLSATISQLSRIRTQTKTQAQGTMNGLPILVESSGQIAAWAGDQAVWTQAVGTSSDVAETGLTIAPSGNLPLNNPAPAPISCLGSVSAMCAVHPLAWTFGTSSANGKPVGKQTLTIAFADTTTGTTADYVYDGWSLRCDTGWAYVGGIPVDQATRATSDVYADCVAGNIVFTQGAVVMAAPSQDRYGRYETVLPTLMAAFLGASFFTNAPMPSITQGQVFGINTRDGGFAKVYFTSGVSIGGPLIVLGMALHANADGTYPY